MEMGGEEREVCVCVSLNNPDHQLKDNRQDVFFMSEKVTAHRKTAGCLQLRIPVVPADTLSRHPRLPTATLRIAILLQLKMEASSGATQN